MPRLPFERNWGGGFLCRKYGHESSIKGKKALHRRCQKCLTGESPTSHTIFLKLKFPIENARHGLLVIYYAQRT
jgi:hypothetical protein